MVDWDAYRKLFPHTEQLIYFNHAAVSPLHRRSMDAIRAFQRERSLHNIEYFPDILEEKQRFKELLGKLIHAPADYIAITENTSMGLNWLARGISWKSGDRIILNNFEFPANVYPFLQLQEQGVRIDFVAHRDGRIVPDDIAAMIRPETRLISISFVEFLNGYRNDLAAISRLCQKHNIMFCVDAIQGLGALQIDVQELAIDFLACGGHKWLMFPLGTAFFYVAPQIFDRLSPMAVGWLSVENSWDFFNYELNLLPTAARFETGAFNIAGVIGAKATLQMFLEIGTQHIEHRILANTDYLIKNLQEGGYELFTAIEQPHRSGIVTFYHSRAEELAGYLKQNRIIVSLREGMIRVSPHFYNTVEEIDTLMEFLKRFDKTNKA